MSTVAVHLDAQLDAFVEEKVRSGAFSDRADVIMRALDNMRRDDVKLLELKQKIQESLDEMEAGLGIPVEDVETWLDGLGR